MDHAEFRVTVEYFLSLVGVQAVSMSLDRLFDEVDLDNDGWLTYEDYSRFIRSYFRALPTVEANRETTPIKLKKNFKNHLTTLQQSLN
jgi:hypothetical protein